MVKVLSGPSGLLALLLLVACTALFWPHGNDISDISDSSDESFGAHISEHENHDISANGASTSNSHAVSLAGHSRRARARAALHKYSSGGSLAAGASASASASSPRAAHTTTTTPPPLPTPTTTQTATATAATTTTYLEPSERDVSMNTAKLEQVTTTREDRETAFTQQAPPAAAEPSARRHRHRHGSHGAVLPTAAAAVPPAAPVESDPREEEEDQMEENAATTLAPKVKASKARDAVAKARVAWLSALRTAAPSLLSTVEGVYGDESTRCSIFATAETLFETHAGPSGEKAKMPDYELKSEELALMPEDGCVGARGTGVIDAGVPVMPWTTVDAAAAELPVDPSVNAWRRRAEELIASSPRYGKCALVGNARSLLSHTMGTVIDTEFDAVMRLNQGPTDGFEAHVGKRTTFRLVNRKWITAYANNPNLQLEKRVTLVASRTDWALYLGACRRINKRRSDVACRLMTRGAVDRAGDVLRSMKAKVEAVRGISYPGRGSPSSGFVGLHLLLQLCRNVTVFGMSDGGSLREAWHYFEPRQFHASREFSADPHHSFDLEHDMLQVLDAGGAMSHVLWARNKAMEDSASRAASSRLAEMGMSHADLVSERPMPKGCVKDKGTGCRNVIGFDGSAMASANTQPNWMVEYLPYIGGTLKSHATARSMRGGLGGYPDILLSGKVHIPRSYGADKRLARPRRSAGGGAGGLNEAVAEASAIR